MRISTILIWILTTFSGFRTQCRRIADGIYTVKYLGHRNLPEFQVDIHGSRYIIGGVGRRRKGEIVINKDCLFQVDTWTKQKRTKAEDSIFGYYSIISHNFGQPCMEISAIKGDSTFFRVTCLDNLHVTFAKGYLLKKR